MTSSRTRTQAALPDVATGIRAALVTVVPFYFASAGGHRELAWTALGGWLGTLTDPGGSRSSRFRVIAAFAVLGGCALAIAEFGGHDVFLATLLLTAVTFAGSLLRALGASMASIGTMLAILVAVGTSRARATDPWRDAAFFALGAAGATLLSTVVWPVWTHLAVRRAIGAVYAKMSAYAEAIEALLQREEPIDDAVWSALARAHRRPIREAIEAATKAAAATRARRPGESRLGGNLRVLLGFAEAQFPLLVALSEEISTVPRDERAAIIDALVTLRERYEAIHASLVTTVIPSRPSRTKEEEPGRPMPALASPSPTAALAERLVEASHTSWVLGTSLDADHGSDDEPAESRRSRVQIVRASVENALRTLRDALSPRSIHLEHAARVAFAGACASFVGMRVSPTRAHWVTVTTIAVLQPFAGATWKRAVERVVGTFFGSVLAALVMLVVHAPLVLVAIMFPLSIAAVATRPRSYRLFTFFLTPVFVLVSERYPGDLWTAAERAGDSLVGGLIALVAAFVVWPSGEKERLPEALARVLEATTAYARAVLGDDADRRTDEDVAARRRACGVALSEAETSLDRWLAEPIGDREGRERAVPLLTYTRRLGGALTALVVYLHTARDKAGARAAFAAEAARTQVNAYVATCLGEALAMVRGAPQTDPPLPALAPPRLDDVADAHMKARLSRIVALAAVVAGLVESERGEAGERGEAIERDLRAGATTSSVPSPSSARRA